MRAEFAHLVSA